jgi:ParB/RepB/Spo0J family partition protein
MQEGWDEKLDGPRSPPPSVSTPPPITVNGHARAVSAEPSTRLIRVALIEVREQARTHFDNIPELAQNIRDVGQVHPIVVCELGPNRYLLKHGERRLQAVRDVLKRDLIFASVVEADPDSIDWELAQLSENIQREDYRPLDIARRLQTLLDTHQWSAATLALKLSITKSWISKRLSLLDAPPQVQQAIENGKLSETDYYNHKQRYQNGLAETDPSLQGRGPGRTAMVRLPLGTVVVLARLMNATFAQKRLTPVELSRRPTKKELLAIFEAWTPQLQQFLTELDDGEAAS